MRTSTECWIQLGDRRVEYRMIRTPAARKLRLRVGPNGVEVVQPAYRSTQDVRSFLHSNAAWLLDQLQRVDRLREAGTHKSHPRGELLFRGHPTQVRIHTGHTRTRRHAIGFVNGEIVLRRATASRTPISRSLENWLRGQARMEIEKQLASLSKALQQKHGRLYVMEQRTRWGSCSSRRNLSFNWRLILAPDFVLRYLVTHEAAHLAVPNHSAHFWLTVQGLCPEMERAKAWLRAHQSELLVDIESVLAVDAVANRQALDALPDRRFR